MRGIHYLQPGFYVNITHITLLTLDSCVLCFETEDAVNTKLSASRHQWRDKILNISLILLLTPSVLEQTQVVAVLTLIFFKKCINICFHFIQCLCLNFKATYPESTAPLRILYPKKQTKARTLLFRTETRRQE